MKLNLSILLIACFATIVFSQGGYHKGRHHPGRGQHPPSFPHHPIYHQNRTYNNTSYTPKKPTPPSPSPTPQPPTPPAIDDFPLPPQSPSPFSPPIPYNVQDCHDNLGELMDSEGNTLMTNTCEPFVDGDDETKFKFTVSFLEPYIFNEECLDLQVIFETTTLNEGAAACDEWQFDADTQSVIWNIKLSDFVDVYGCQWIAEDDQFTWICEFKVNILFMDMQQQCYNAKLQVTVDRVHDGELVVNVQKNEVEGVCCENELNIETELRFCTTFECDAFLDSPLTVVRKEDFYVEHRIVSAGFSNFYLSQVSVSLSNFLPVVVDSAQELGRVRLALRSNIAKPDLVLNVISKLEKTDPNRRFLQSEIGEDYRLKGVEQITIVRPEQDKIQIGEEQKLSQNQIPIIETSYEDQRLMTAAIVSVGILAFIMLGFGVFCFYWRRNKMKNTQFSDKTSSISA